MEIPALRSLVAVVEAGSFARAAAHLGVNASTLTRRVAAVEDELGVTLLERTHTGVKMTSGGRAVVVRVRRVLADLEALERVAQCTGVGKLGDIHLGAQVSPIGEPLQSLLSAWHAHSPAVELTLHEMNDNEIRIGLAERRLDAALVTQHTLWRHAAGVPLYREPLVVALPEGHPLCAQSSVTWAQLRKETFLTQGWDDSHAAQELFASFLGSGTRFRNHPASKQSVLVLVAAGFGITLALRGQSQVAVAGVTYRPVAEPNATVEMHLVWAPESEEAVVGRFIAFMRDEARARHLL